MMKKMILIISIVFLMINEKAPAFSSGLIDTGRHVAHKLISNIYEVVPAGGAVIVGTMVLSEDLRVTSEFGRIFVQMIAAGFSERGFHVIDPRLQSSLEMDVDRGELILTRENRLLMHKNYPDAFAALSGTYSITNNRVYFSIRLVRLSDGIVLSSYEGYLSKNKEIEELTYIPKPVGPQQFQSRTVRVTTD